MSDEVVVYTRSKRAEVGRTEASDWRVSWQERGDEHEYHKCFAGWFSRRYARKFYKSLVRDRMVSYAQWASHSKGYPLHHSGFAATPPKLI